MDEADDPRFVERLRRRDEAAFDQLVRRQGPRVLALVTRLIGDRAEAEDLTQEVFVSVFKAIGDFRGDSKLSTWIHRVAINHCHNRRKYLGRRARPGREAWDEQGPAAEAGSAEVPLSSAVARPDQQAEGNEVERLLQRALLALADDQRELVVLRDVEGLAYEEIQQITGLAEGTVKSKLHRARAELVRELGRLRGEARASRPSSAELAGPAPAGKKERR